MNRRPITRVRITNGVPDSVLEAFHRRFTKYQNNEKYWNLGGNDDGAYLKLLKAEIDRREKSPEPDFAVKLRRAKYKRDRENLNENVPLSALELKKSLHYY